MDFLRRFAVTALILQSFLQTSAAATSGSSATSTSSVGAAARFANAYDDGYVLTLWRTDYTDAELDRILGDLQQTGTRHLTLPIWGCQSTLESSDVGSCEHRSWDYMMRIANAAEARGLKLAFLPIMAAADWGWRGMFRPRDVDGWFRTYTQWILRIAREAQRRGHGELVVASEFKQVFTYESHWRRVINEVKQVYGGSLIVTANWDAYRDIRFWDAVDAVGISAYFPIARRLDAPQSELDASWMSIKNELLTFARRLNKPLHITEVGYNNESSTAMTPWAYSHTNPQKNDALQARCFEAFRRAWKNERELVRANVWSTLGGESAPQEISAEPRGKIAERVIDDFVRERRALQSPTPRGPRVALTIDDIPVHASLVPGQTRLQIMEAITAALQKHGLPPVHGFYNGFGMQEAGADQVMRLWLDRGNKLANHGYGHVGINDSELATYVAEIEKNEPLLETLRPERDWFFFRYPNLHEGETLEKRNSVRAYLAGRGYRIAPVTIDSADWAFKAPYKRCMLKNDVAAVEWMKREFLEHGIQKLAQSRESGRRLFGREVPQILLLHAGAFDSQIIDEFIARYLAAGVTFITLEEALADPAYSQDSGYVSRTGRQYFDQLLDRAGLAYPPGPRLPTTQLERACR